MSAPPAGAPSKGRKILRRTLSGARLVTVLAAILWWTSRSAGGEPILYVSIAVLLAAVFELSRMGRCKELGVRPVLELTALGLIALHWVAVRVSMESRVADFVPGLFAGAWSGNLLFEYAWVALLTFAGSAAWRGGWALPRRAEALRLPFVLLAATLAYFVFLLASDPAEAAPRIRIAFVVLCVLALGAAPRIWLSGKMTDALALVGLSLWLLPPLPCLWRVWHAWGTRGLVALLVLSKIGDTAGYYVGGAIGRSHPFPSISPGKTTAGCVASLVAATSIGVLLSATGVLPAGRLGLVGGACAGAALNLAAQAGDLFESWIKRRAGVKDSSTWFGPSGGLLDQLDSVLFSIPAALVAWPWLFPE